MGYFDHVAIGIDFSEASEVALTGCTTLVEAVRAKRVTVLHAVKQVVLPAADLPEVVRKLEDLRGRMTAAAQTQMAEMCDRIAFPEGVEVVHVVAEGTPARAIPEAAHAAGAQVLLVGTHSRKGIKRWLRGSVAETMVQGAPLPVLVMPTGDDGVAPEEELKRLDHVLVAVDVHRKADHVVSEALQAAVSFAGHTVDVTLLTVADLPSMPTVHAEDDAIVGFLDTLRGDAETLLADLEARHAGEVRNLHHLVRVGEPDEKILAVAEELGAELIVVGSHGQGGAPRLQLGSVTAHVIRHADVSVLVVPSHDDDEA